MHSVTVHLLLTRAQPSCSYSYSIKRDQEYRNALYGEYSCRIQKAADAVRTKLNVSD